MLKSQYVDSIWLGSRLGADGGVKHGAETHSEDKEVRFNAACAPIEAGQVLLPREAPWLADFRRELMGFPRTVHNDQADSVSQFLNWTTGAGFRRTPFGRTRKKGRSQDR